MATPALPVAAAAAAGLVLGRWLEQQEGSALPAIGAAVAVPSRAAGRVAATGMRMTAAAVIAAGGAVASAGSAARDAAGHLDDLVNDSEAQGSEAQGSEAQASAPQDFEAQDAEPQDFEPQDA